MKAFMDEEFLLTTPTAQHIYHEYAEKLPVIDYHCHLSPKEIYENISFSSITEAWLGADHYKWRQMRSNGTEEKYITGDATDREKFRAFAATLDKAIGNPIYHWSHLELKRYFGFEGHLSARNADEVFDLCNEKLKNMTSRSLMIASNVECVVTTDDPADSLEYHKLLREEGFQVKVLPAWRPEKAMSLQKPDYLDYLAKLEAAAGKKISSFTDLIEVLKERMEFFAENGCCISDHSLEYVMYKPATAEEVESIYQARLNGQIPSHEDELKFETAFMVAMGQEYAKKNWVMQLHFGVQRNLNSRIFKELGADAGIDAINSYSNSIEMGQYLNALESLGALPKTILYSLNPTDNASIGTVIGAFQDSSCVGKIQQGSGWWFNDNKTGMIDQMISLANLGLLGNFIGMLTDSRSFLSYPRHEYFRRIFCELVGGWVENGEFPYDEELLKDITEGVSYRNTKRYFGF